MQKILLDVGCGSNKRSLEGVDIVHDCEVIPWPVEDGACTVVVMSHLIEHIKPWLSLDVINECWRILEEDGSLMISTPYATSFGYFQDPTHCNPWNEATPTYFMPGQPLYEVYRPKPWNIKQLVWDLNGNLEVALGKISENGKPN